MNGWMELTLFLVSSRPTCRALPESRRSN
jgi:hypothetical protein